MNLAYEPLFTPFSIRNTRIKNRYFMAAMGTVTHNDEDGAYLPDAVDYFFRSAAGGVGMIITGAPVEQLPFEDVEYWQELCSIMDWSRTHVHSTLHICWGAQAALYHHYGIEKVPLEKKLFGVFPHRVEYKNPILLRGFDDVFMVPHSRHTTVRREDIERVPELKILASSEQAGVYAIFTAGGRQIFLTGHAEYDPDTLRREYERDKALGLPIAVPENYFPGNDDTKPPLVTWRSHANLLFSNWLNYFVYQTTPYDFTF